MSPSNSRIDRAALHEISLLCGVDAGQIEDVYDCTPFQLGIAGDPAYIQRFVLSISTDLDTAGLSDAMNEVVALNQVLRTRIVDSQQLGLVQVVLQDDPATRTRRISTALDQYLEGQRVASMDLAAPLFRSTVIEDARKLVLTVHHAICDQSSLLFLVDDVTKIYRKQTPTFHAPFKQFVDYCGSVRQSEARDFWAKQFIGTSGIFPSVPINCTVDASSRTSRQIRSPANLASPALLPLYLECAWAILAHAYTEGDTVAYGVVYSGRKASAVDGMESTLGPTIVTLPAEVAMNPEDTVGEFLKRRQLGRQAIQGCGAAMQMGLNNIRKVSESAKMASEFQTVLNFLHRPPPSAVDSPIYLDYEDDIHKAYAICLTFSIGSNVGVDSQGRAGGLEVLADFDKSLVSLTAMNRLLVQLEHVLQTLAQAAAHTRIGQLVLLSSADRLDALKSNNTIAESVNDSLHAMVRKMAIAHPDDTAIDAWDGRMTYLELVAMADDLAETLRQRGVTRQSVIPCLFEFSRWAVVAALAVLTVGGVCMNLEPSHPRGRHQKLLELTKPHALLCSTALAENAHGLAPCVLTVSADTVSTSVTSRYQIDGNDESEQIAYLIFTSGSTGSPKGAVLQHRALATSLTSVGRYVGLRRGVRTLQCTSYVWDVSVAEIFGSLILGGCVCIPSTENRESGLADYINAANAEVIFQTPTALRNLSPHEIPTVKTIVSGGERVRPEAAITWGSKFRLVNGYGPCESSIFVTLADLGPQAKYPETIGRPVGCAVWIADPINPARLVPIGAVGELIIESVTVANGYFCNDEATTAAFIIAPAWAPRRSQALTKARRFYRTGDLGKYNDDGSICFIGRRDHQVKIRGQRLELGEIESVIAQFPAVRAIAVVSHAPRSQTEVVAVLALDYLPREKALEEHSDEYHDIVAEFVSSVRSFTATKLPSYMVPTQWLVVQDLPKAASGKVDRQAIGRWLKDTEPLLSSTLDANDSQTKSISPPVSAAEKTLRTIWSNVLDIPEVQIGRESSFLRLGGDSITAMQVATRSRRLGLKLSVQMLLQLPTLSATAFECKGIPASVLEEVNNKATGPWKASMSPVQKLFVQGGGPAAHNHFNQSRLLQLNTSASEFEIQAALQRVLDVHPMLRARFSQRGSAGEWEQSTVTSEGSWRFQAHSSSSSEATRQIVNTTQSSLNIKEGPVFAADLICGAGIQGEKLLFLAAHHLVCDLVSWRVILEDFEIFLTNPDDLADPTTSFLAWVESENRKTAPSSSPQPPPTRNADLDYWNVRDLSLRVAETVQQRFNLEQNITERLMGESCNAPFNTRPAELMLAAVVSAFQEVFPDRGSPAVYSEGHGREFEHGSPDVSHTVGWFTTMYPISVELRSGATPDQAVVGTKDGYRSALQDTKWFRDQQGSCKPLQRTDLELLFNFAGRLPPAKARDRMLNWRNPEDYGFSLQNIAGDVEQIGLLSVFCFVQDHRLHFWVDYNKNMAHQAQILQWIHAIERTLRQFADELPTQAPRLTVSDVPILNSFGGADIDRVNQRLEELECPASNVESIYPCSAVQEGILFAQLKGQGDEYRDRLTLQIIATDPNHTVSVQDLEQAWRSVCKAHPIFRTVFASGLDDATAFQQIVLREVEPVVKHETLDGDLDIFGFLQTYRRPFIPETTPPHVLTVVQKAADNSTHVVFDASHAIIDAKSMHIIAEQFTLAYEHPSQLPRGPSYSDYILWAQTRKEVSRQYWMSHLSNQKPCLLPTKDVPQEAQTASLQVDVPFNRAVELNRFCRHHGVTIASFAQVVWALVLKRYSTGAVPSPCFGCLHSGRDVVDDAERIIGPLLTMLISRFDTSPPLITPLDLMNQARQDAVEGSDKAGCSLGEIHEQLGTSLLFNTAMSIQTAWPDELGQEGSAVRMTVVQADDPTEYPITVAVAYSKESFRVRLMCKPKIVPSAFARDLAQYFAAVAEALLDSPEQPLSTINLFQDMLKAPLPSTGEIEGRSQYWEDHLSRVQRVSAFPSNVRARRVLKDAVRSIVITVPLPSHQTWAPARLQASWALCLSRLTGNKQVLFGVTADCPSKASSNPRETGTAIVPYAVQLTESSTPRSLSEDVRSWAQDSRPFISEGRDYIWMSRGELGSAGELDNVLSIHSGVLGAKDAFEPLPHEQGLIAVDSHPDDWGCGLAVSCAIRTNGEVSVQAKFDSLLMDPARADLILRQYEHCIIQMFQESCAETLLTSLDPISNHERSIMRRWSSSPIRTANDCVHDEISQQATEHPNNAAVNAWDGEISYKELDDLSDRLAVHLVDAGVRTGTFVPLFFEKSTAVVVVILAVMKAGGAFVPMKIDHPEKRRAAILAELDSPVALISSSLRDEFGDLGPSVRKVIGTDMNHLRSLNSDSKSRSATARLADACYIIYTSGSTGKPKGVVVDHSNLAISALSFRNRLGMSQRTRTLQYVSFTFDPSLSDIFMTLLSGGCLFMPTEEERADGAGIVQAVNRTSANYLCLTPSLATLFRPDDVPTVQTLVLGGEAMRADVVEAWADRVALVNAYGPSEATIEASCRLVRHNTLDHNNIGSPDDCLYWVVDENNHDRLVPIGCPGELLIQGPKVTRGYLHSPEKTEAVFIDHPAWMKDYVGEATKHHVYKTGDIVQQHIDCSATYLGRNGPEIKLRGQRMDVGEAEHHIREALGREWQAAVDIVHWEEDNRDPSLICFLARRAGDAKAAGAGALLEPELELATRISTALASVVPVYMIPDFYLPLQNLPSTSSDKTDRKALRSIAGHLPPRKLKSYAANGKPIPQASNGTRQNLSQHESSSSPQASQPSDKSIALQKAWSDVLGIPSHSIHRSDDWFSIGGNSIKAMRLVAAARKQGLKLTVADVFNTPVLADMELAASFGINEESSRRQQLFQTKNENLFPRICARASFLALESIESAAIATDAQAWMLAVGEVSITERGFLNDFYIDCKDGLDVVGLTKACAEVTRHHPVLRTMFVQLEDTIYQVVLKDDFCMAEQKSTSSSKRGLQEEYARRNVPRFFYENLSSDGLVCHRLRLHIHHALYDAIFLQLVFNDIASAYCGRPLTTGMPFHTWIAQVGGRDFTATKAFWKDMLHRSSMTLLHPPNGPCRYDTQTGQLRTSVPIHSFQNSAGTESSVLKAAWATVLSRELCSQDVVFAEVSANRSSEFIETDQVLGPCVNYLPVRAYPACHKDFNSLVREIEAQHRASVPHHDLGCRQIIRDCTDWPSWTRLGSVIIYQNHGSSMRESQASSFSIGDMECNFSACGPSTDATDVLVAAEPEEHAVNILLQYIPGVIGRERAERLLRNLTTVLETGHLDPLSGKSPGTVSPAESTWSLVAADSNEETAQITRPIRLPTERAQSLVTEAWREVKLFRDGVLPEANVSMFDCGADIVSALLLSRFYLGFGQDVGVADIVCNPTQRSQSLLLDGTENAERAFGSPDMINEPFAPGYAVRAVGPSDSTARRRNTRYDLSDVDLIQHDGHIANYAVFPLEERSKTASISAALETGLSETLAKVPLLAGRVLRDSAKRSYVLCRPHDTCELAMRHLDDSFPSYEKLESMHFPPSMLPRALLLPLSMPSATSVYGHEWGEDGVPCLFLQASFMRGGMILATAWHHQVADAYSCDVFLALLAENTRAALGGHTPQLRMAYELDVDRAPFVGVGKGEGKSEDKGIDDSGFPHQLGSLVRQGPSRLADIVASGRRLGEVVSMLVHIPEEQAAALKKICTPAAPKDEFDFVSTYQCVSTLLHRIVVRARLRTGCMQPNEATAVLHAVNVRGRVPEARVAYFGNAVASSLMTPMIASDLVGEAGLQNGALNSRHDIRNVSLHHLRRYAHAHAAHGAATVMQAMAALMTTGAVVTSWQQMRLAAYDLGFGLPEAFRAPSLGLDGQIIIYPTLPGQGVVASITSRKHLVQAMHEDSELLQYAEVWDVDRGFK